MMAKEQWGLFATEISPFVGRSDQLLSDILNGKADLDPAVDASLELLKKDLLEADAQRVSERLKALNSGDPVALSKTLPGTENKKEMKRDLLARVIALRKRRGQ